MDGIKMALASVNTGIVNCTEFKGYAYEYKDEEEDEDEDEDEYWSKY